MKKLIAVILALILTLMFSPLWIPALANGQEVCAQEGDWSEHQDPEDFSEVENAVEYCVKGGSANSQGCEGYLFYGSFDQVENVINSEDACNLSHWSYRISETPEPEETPENEWSTEYYYEANCEEWVVYGQDYLNDEPFGEPYIEDNGEWEVNDEDESFEWENLLFIQEPNCEEPTATPTDEPTATPTDEPTSEPTPTQIVDPTPTPTDRPCPYEEIGELFLLTGPEGQQAWFGSYQRNPNTGAWAIPNTGSQQQCLGWVAVNASEGKIIYRDCNGNVNYLTYKCEGGGPCYAYVGN